MKSRKPTVTGAAMVLIFFSWWLAPAAHAAESVSPVTYLVRSDGDVPLNLTKSELAQIYDCSSQFQSSFKPLIPATGAVRSDWLSYLGLSAPGSCVSTVGASGETITENDGRFLTDGEQLVPYDVSAWIDQVSKSVADRHGNSILGSVDGVGALQAGPLSSCSGQTVTPSTDIQQAVNDAPEGTTFCFAPGTYAEVSIAPKNGDIFDGQNESAVLDGLSSAQYAFNSSTAVDVTIRGFVIQRYSTPLQKGAIQSFGTTGWTILNNYIANNSASGVATDSRARVLNNRIDWNGQEGYAAHGSNILYENNEIAYNNHGLAVDGTWEAGGGKAWGTSYATFKNNYVHDNGGNGLWDDTNNIYIIYDGNVVTDNWGAGIYHEIGYDATIINNTISNNGLSTSPGGGQNSGWLWDAGIQLRESGALSASSPILISGNTVTNNYNGISLIESPASGCTNSSLNEGAYGPCHIQNVLVQNNVVTMSVGATGAVEDGAGGSIFTSRNVRFVGNVYHVDRTVTHRDDGYAYGWFAWADSWFDWSQWQASGNDANGDVLTVAGGSAGQRARDEPSTPLPAAFTTDRAVRGM